MEDRQITSGPTIVKRTSWVFEQQMIKTNKENFDVLLATLAPQLYIISQSLELFKINAEILPTIIKAIANVVYSSKLGEVIIEIRPDAKTGKALIKRVRSIDTRHLDIEALIK